MSEENPSGAALRFTYVISILALLTATLVLLGWLLGIASLTNIVPDWPRMVPLTALGFVLIAVSLWLKVPRLADVAHLNGRRSIRPVRTRLAVGFASLAALVGLDRLATHFFGWSAGLDYLGLGTLSTGARGFTPGSMSPATALAFTLLGGALTLEAGNRLRRMYQTLAICSFLVGWLGLARYVLGGAPLIPFGSMAIHTALMFVALSAAALSLRNDVGLPALLVSEGAGGASARYLLPAALLIPLGAAALALYSTRTGGLGTEAALSLFALSSVLVFAAIVWATAAHLERADRERRHTQKQLVSSRERTRLIIETALDAVITIDSSGMITGWSAQAESLFGWTRAEAVGRSLALTIIPERYREPHQRGLQRYLETGAASVLNRRVELTALHRDQREFPVEISITPLRGEETSFSAFVRDITERRRAEDSLRESQQLLQTIIDNSPAVVYVKDLLGRYLLVNRRFGEIFHLSHDAILGRTDHELFPKEAADAFRDMDVRVATADHALTEEETVPQADGLHVYISIKAPLRDAAGRVRGVFGISTDITDRTRAEERLRTQLARLNLLDATTRAIGERQDLRSIYQVVVRSLEEHLPADFGCMCMYDESQRELSVTCLGIKSQALAQSLALPEHSRVRVRENGLSRCVRGELIYEPDLAQLPLLFPSRLASGGLRSLVMVPLLVERKVFGVMMVARHEPNGFSSGDCEFLRQLSAHVALAAHQAQLYSSLQSAYEDLRQTQQSVMQQERLRALGQMASGVAHDINNALSPASLYAQSLIERDRSLSPEARDYLIIIQRAIEDVAQTVGRLREFYRPRESLVTLAPVELNRLLRQVVDLTRARWSDMPQERGIVIRVETDLAPDVPTVMGAESEIRDALTNLVLNAVDAMPEGGTLTLRTRCAQATTSASADAPLGTRVRVEVCDSGVGMSEAVRDRCLEPFFTSKGDRGTGLGLAMVYGMVQRHSAELEIESKLGVGTTMRLIFQVGASSESSPPDIGARHVESLRVLVVDDDPLLLQSLQQTLELDGHDVGAAEGGQAGIDEFIAAQKRGEPFAVVITDLGMPKVDGRTVAASVKTSSPTTPVILLTGWGHRLQAEGELPEHVDRVLAKPPKLNELRAALVQITGSADLDRSETPAGGEG